MSSAVHDLQRAILDSSQSLTTLLRHTKLIASKLNLEDVEKWVDLELNGYPGDAEPPKYREFVTDSVEVRNPVRGWEFAGHLRVSLRAHQPIAELENLSRSERLTTALEQNLPIRDSMGGTFGSQWPQRATLSGANFKRILELVRNELLQWTTELEKRGIKGEEMDFNVR